MEGFGWFKKKDKSGEGITIEEGTKAQKTKDNIVLGTAAGLAAVGVYAGTEINKQNHDLENSPVPASAPADAENPTLGMTSTDSPAPITIPVPAEMSPQPEKVIDLAEVQHIIEHPEH